MKMNILLKKRVIHKKYDHDMAPNLHITPTRTSYDNYDDNVNESTEYNIYSILI